MIDIKSKCEAFFLVGQRGRSQYLSPLLGLFIAFSSSPTNRQSLAISPVGINRLE